MLGITVGQGLLDGVAQTGHNSLTVPEAVGQLAGCLARLSLPARVRAFEGRTVWHQDFPGRRWDLAGPFGDSAKGNQIG